MYAMKIRESVEFNSIDYRRGNICFDAKPLQEKGFSMVLSPMDTNSLQKMDNWKVFFQYAGQNAR